MTTTTSVFQHYPDYFNSIEECENFKCLPKIQTNTRYRNFCQTHFTAGDEEQFEEYKHCITDNNSYIDNDVILNDDHIWDKYKNIDHSSVSNTFRYMFYKFKKGIYVKIVNNQLKVFLPFSNSNFINEWHNSLDVSDSKTLFKYVCSVEKRNYNEKNINFNISSWYANNFLVRYEYPIKEGDTNVCVIKNMLEELCLSKTVPDIEFFINRRDFPLHHKDSYEPYSDLWNCANKPLISHNYSKYSPILSMCKNDSFADILIPTHEDWTRVQSEHNIYFPHSLRSIIRSNINKNWDSKKPIAIFRGASTGKGVTIETNPRLKASYISSKNYIDEKDNLIYLDAGITKWNVRPRKILGSNKLETINIESLPFSLVDEMPIELQSNYKYILHINGHVSAFRLSVELSLHSVILIVETEWKTWYSHMLKPYIHYVPIKNDLSDLIDKIKWCKNNDSKCKEISDNAFEFYKQVLSKDNILTNLQETLNTVKQNIGDYHCFNVLYKDILLEEESKLVNSYLKTTKKPKKFNKLEILPTRRSYGLLKCISFLLVSHKNNLLTNIKDEKLDENIIYSSKSTNIYCISYDKRIQFCIKKTLIDKKDKENIHEVFVGLFCINNILRHIPNFCFTYGFLNNNEIINEFIPDSLSLFDYIKSDTFDFKTYIFIIFQVALAIQVAQNQFNFVHYDLTSWNILLQNIEKPIQIDYLLDENTCVSLKTNLIPIIVDYGKSYFIHKHQHHGFVKLFKFTKSQDILSLLVNTIYQILTYQHLSKTDFYYLMKLANFLTGNNFRKKHFENSKDMKSFLNHQKKYSLLIDHTDDDLPNVSPVLLFDYITKVFKFYNFDYIIKERVKYIPYMNTCDEELMYRIIINKRINNKYFNKRIKTIIDDKNDEEKINRLNTILTNYKVFLNNDTKKLYKRLRKITLTRKILKKDNEYVYAYKKLNVNYDEKDLYSISKIKEIFRKVKGVNIDYKTIPYKFEDVIMKRLDITNISDFENIIQKLSQTNTHFKQKLTKL